MNYWIIKLAAVLAGGVMLGSEPAVAAGRKGAEPRDELGRTPLMLAARAGDAAEVMRLVKSGAALEARSKGRWTPLMYAVEKRHAEVVGILLAHGADPQARGREWTSTLSSAFGNPALLEALIRAGAEVNDPRENLLTNAAGLGLLDVAQVLIRLGADVHGRPNARPLNAAIRRRQTYADSHVPEMVALLLKAGARPTTDDLGAAMWVEQHDAGRPITALLLQAGAPTTATAGSRWTALHHAALNRDAVAAKLLLDAGAELEAKDEFGRTPLDLAASVGAGEVVALLLARGANAAGTEQRRPLAAAGEGGHPEIARALMQAGAKAGVAEARELQMAARRLNLPAVQVLLDAGADPNFQEGGSGWTALALALGDPQVVSPKGGWADPETLREPTLKLTRIFLALPGYTQESKNSALLHAAGRQPLEIIRLLVEAGADPATSSVNFFSVRENAAQNPDRRVAEYLRGR
ncbi:MAG TPA: ankyrin repeat domain-containing protein [Chthoniobacteraceae bacterium]|jgi:ankyrin repeat protein|nr:ankyrin repeat domain-containing protein [Chthoniobacteraceae bacterium]